MTNFPRFGKGRSILTGFKRKCPSCEKGKMFSGYLKLAEKCPGCAAPIGDIRAVSAAIGITPVTYMTQLRIARAKKLVREGTSIAEAAVEAGFSDQPHLTRVMKRHMGITPGRLLPEI